jgi:hypothetical protein
MDVTEARSLALCGVVSEVVDELGRLQELGATRAYLDLMDLTDLEQIHLVADEVVPNSRNARRRPRRSSSALHPAGPHAAVPIEAE